MFDDDLGLFSFKKDSAKKKAKGAFDEYGKADAFEAPDAAWERAGRFLTKDLPERIMVRPSGPPVAAATPAESMLAAAEGSALPPAPVPTPPAAMATPVPVPEEPSGPLGRASKVLPVASEPPQGAVFSRTLSDETRAKAADPIATDPVGAPSIAKMDRVVSPQDSASRGGFSSSRMEKMFRAWYGLIVWPHGANPDPDSPLQTYDWRSAFIAGAKPRQDERGNWLWPGDFVITTAEKGQPRANPKWGGGTLVPINPTFEPKNDIRDPIGMWSRKYKGWAGDL